MATIQGEKVFTKSVRLAALRAYDRAMNRLKRETQRTLARLQADRNAIATARTTKELERVRLRQYSGDPFDLFKYSCDSRLTCCACKRKSFGGVGWAIGFFFCYRKACQDKGDVFRALCARHKNVKARLRAAARLGLHPTFREG